jgi:hypothetical protein
MFCTGLAQFLPKGAGGRPYLHFDKRKISLPHIDQGGLIWAFGYFTYLFIDAVIEDKLQMLNIVSCFTIYL